MGNKLKGLLAVIVMIALAILSFFKKQPTALEYKKDVDDKQKDFNIKIEKEYNQKREELNKENTKNIQVIKEKTKVEKEEYKKEIEKDPSIAVNDLVKEFGLKEFKK